MLEISGLNAGYGQAQALFDANITLADTEIVTILGPNGAGKSTLVNAIAGIITPWSGSVMLDGVNVADAKAHEVVSTGIAVVPEGRRIFAEMNVLDNLKIGAFNQRARKELDTTLEEVHEIFPRLKERARQLAGSMSGGEQQMLAIGRALMSKPKVLLLDEPSLGLAPIIVKDIFRILSTITEIGVSVLLVEQNANEALKLASRAYVLEEGRIVIEGTSDELLGDERLRKAYLGM